VWTNQPGNATTAVTPTGSPLADSSQPDNHFARRSACLMGLSVVQRRKGNDRRSYTTVAAASPHWLPGLV
jgi:hypothetical protein